MTPVIREAREYLATRLTAYALGSYEYFACVALEQAVLAAERGDYGIGAVAVTVADTSVREYRAGNSIVTSNQAVGHAETNAILAALANENSQRGYSTEDTVEAPPAGLTVVGTLEPCPMCACVLTNVGAGLSLSVVQDGQFSETDGYPVSDGAATVLGEKWKLQPNVWKQIQVRGGLSFRELVTEDKELKSLCWRIFSETREQIDCEIADRDIWAGHW